MYQPDRVEFARLYQENLRVPVFLEAPLNGENPITVMEKLNLPGSPVCLLESGKGTESHARYSFLGFHPHCAVKSMGTRVEKMTGGLTAGSASQDTQTYDGDPYLILREIMENHRGVRVDGLPKFWGGAMGYFGYDMGRHFEVLPEMTVDDLKTPESYLMFFDRVICFDHLEQSMKIVVTVKPGAGDAEWAYQGAVKELRRILGAITEGQAGPELVIDTGQKLAHTFIPECNVSKGEFEDMVARCKEYIKAGDIFQANLSLRLGKETSVDPFFLYKVLRQINPSPYMSYIDFGDMQLVSSSPELLVRLTGDLAETRPIAGTRKRGENRAEDLALAHELISNEKEKAEHIMLVDLERNDLGRVCRYGTVEVDELMVIEEYSHVMHIVSNVRGRLAPDKNRFDLLKSCFPGGTITGAPKIRSMEIIEELEPTRRGPYTGSACFLGYAGEMETNIIIRTILMKDGRAYVQAGAGIVADSEPEREYYESMKKAEALLRALEVAEELAAGGRHSCKAGQPGLKAGQPAVDWVFLDGRFVPAPEARISVFDHGFLYGDGLFETMRAYDGCIYLLDDHLDRLFRSAQALGLAMPWSRQELTAALDRLIELNGPNLYIRLTVSRGPGPIGIDPTLCPRPTIVIAGKVPSRNEQVYVRGAKAVFTRTLRSLAGASMPEVKSLNFLNNILAKREVMEAGADEGFMLNFAGHVTEGTVSNVFMVKNGVIYTPSTEAGLLPGVTRARVISLAGARGIQAIEALLAKDDFYGADEVFYTNSGSEIVPVTELDGKPVGTGQPGPMTMRMLALYRQDTGRLENPAIKSQQIPDKIQAKSR